MNQFRINAYVAICLVCGLLMPILECGASTQLEINQKNRMPKLIYQSATLAAPEWCGEDAVVFTWLKDANGNLKIPTIDWLNFSTGKSNRISKDDEELFHNCSADGQWIVYQDRKSSRQDDKWRPTCSDCMEWEGYVTDLWRYNVNSNTRQKFAVIRGGSPHKSMSPVGNRLLLGGRHSMSMPMPEPKWETIWFKRSEEYDHAFSEYAWLPNGTGIAVPLHGNSSNKEILFDLFGENGKLKKYKTDFVEIYGLRITKDGAMHFMGKKKAQMPIKSFRCQAQRDRKLLCEQLTGVVDGVGYDISVNGDIF